MDELTFGDDGEVVEDVTPAQRYFTPPVCAIAAFALGFAALMGSNVLTTGINVMLVDPFGEGGIGKHYYLAMGLGALVPAVLSFLLASRAARSETPWEANLARAAIVVAAVSVLGGVAMALSPLFHQS